MIVYNFLKSQYSNVVEGEDDKLAKKYADLFDRLEQINKENLRTLEGKALIEKHKIATEKALVGVVHEFDIRRRKQLELVKTDNSFQQ